MNRSLFNSNLNWPEDFGFWIYGAGPTYVIYVDKDSIAAKSGISPGDKIIELDQQNVSDYSSDSLKSMVRSSTNIPPFLSVQSALRHTQLVSNKNFGIGSNPFGFSYNGSLPVVVDGIELNDSAYLSGLRKGDIIISANNILIKDSNTLKNILDANKIIDLKYIPISQEKVSKFASSGSKSYFELDTVQKFYETVDKYFMHDKMKRDFLLNEIAKYNQFGDIESLGLSLSKVLVNSDERKFISLLKPLISPSHFQQLESFIMTRPDHQLKQTNSFRRRKKSKRSSSRKRHQNSSESSEDSEEFDKKIYADIGKNDRRTLKKIISSYNKSKNFDKLYHNVAKMCQSKSKPELWDYVCPMLDCEHRLCLKERLMKKSCPKIDMTVCCSPQKTIKRPKVYFVESCEPVYCEPKLFRSKIYSSAPSIDCSVKDKFSFLMEQLKCHLNSRECMCVKQALCDYQRNKNFCEFLYKVNRIFNTANKRSLWSKLVCFLDEHDQDYANNQYHSALSQKLDRSRSNLANCSCSRTSLKNPKYFKNTLAFSDREPKPRSKSLFRWEPDSDEELEWKNDRFTQKLNFAQTAMSDHEYFVYDTDTEIYESEEQNFEFDVDRTSNNFMQKLNFDDANRIPIYSKSFSNFNKWKAESICGGNSSA
ncbi:delphilin-like [Brachionus plicatilis]|uniref:Delphilin-like n=1 Tax=Brachionus plicatilis TaxID=10195 RepID=A0A3M7PYK1_BRAPC|nr:delphilin-like [Brachionus plicatilis]